MQMGYPYPITIMEKVDLICEKEKQPQQFPGFRFYPTEEELVGFYLRRKVENKQFKFNVIRDVDLYDFEPWDLSELAHNGRESEWFFFVKPRGHSDGRPNRITAAGFWKATGTDKPVYTHSTSTIIGFRKTLVYYKGRALKAHKTDWIMNEYRLYLGENENGGSTRVCRVYRKAASSMKSFDRRPSIQIEKKDNGNSVHSFTECSGEEGRLSMVKGAGNVSTPKLELEVSDGEELNHLNCLQGWWPCCDGGLSNSMDTICANVILDIM